MGVLTDARRIGIYGVGLLGGSLGLALKGLDPDLEITGIGRSPERLEKAVRLKAIDNHTRDPAAIPGSLDFLVICTPVRLVPQNLAQALPAMKPGGLVTDVGSTKEIVVRECERAAGPWAAFVGSHPMAGSHKTGVEAARADLFKDKCCVITPTPRTADGAMEAVREFWGLLGMKTVVMPPGLHDRLTARSSHLPHLVASTLCRLVKRMDPRIKDVLGNGFHDTTRIAAGDPGMWLDIVLENKAEILGSLKDFRGLLRELEEWIENGDEDQILGFLEEAQSWKRSV